MASHIRSGSREQCFGARHEGIGHTSGVFVTPRGMEAGWRFHDTQASRIDVDGMIAGDGVDHPEVGIDEFTGRYPDDRFAAAERAEM